MMEPDLRKLETEFSRLLGFKLLRLAEGEAEFRCDLGPEHLNVAGSVHGGVLLSLLDLAAGGSGRWSPARGLVSCVTVNLGVEFCGQARAGYVIAKARVMSRSRRMFFSRSEVLAPDGTILALGSSSHKIMEAPSHA